MCYFLLKLVLDFWGAVHDTILTILRDDIKCLEYFNKAIEIIDNVTINLDEQKEIYKKTTTESLILEFNKRYKK